MFRIVRDPPQGGTHTYAAKNSRGWFYTFFSDLAHTFDTKRDAEHQLSLLNRGGLARPLRVEAIKGG